MSRGGGQDKGFVRLGDAVARIAETVRAKRRRRSTAVDRVVELDASPPPGRRATVAALAVLAEAGVIDAGTSVRLLRRTLDGSDEDPSREARGFPEAPRA